ncbi:MAG: NADH-quinone oxidoreductase subunit L [Bryobacteraceae bacterium]|nr:NADH-quinone oxidoreductase subunit L [Bryobacteraceae bacterium]
MVSFLDQLHWIPLFPLAGAALLMVFGPMLEKRARALIGFIACAAVLLSLLWSAGAVFELSQSVERSFEVVKFRWEPGLQFRLAGGGLAHLRADWGFLLDPLSAVMILVVTGISFLIHVYATGYMASAGGYYRFFGYLNLFVFFMLLLVMANNYLLLFAGWEGVGLASYLLIGFFFDRKAAGDAANKAFLTNRIADAALILGILAIFFTRGSVRFLDLAAGPWAATIALLLLIGAMGKSAQFPFHVWLPDAMEGPTPVSALIHAATMVTAGVYLIARSNLVFTASPDVANLVALVGAISAIFAASVALAQDDIKRVLAYSTISQLGFMFLALGVGAYWVAIFHLFTHAFFKALLFLGAGSIIHALHGEHDLHRMGGLFRKMPVTHATMLIGALALAGAPGMAGFFSKDEILAQLYGTGSPALYLIGILTSLMTAFYMWRLMQLAFYAKPAHAREVRESPLSMTGPLVVLAGGSVIVGWLGLPEAWAAGPLFQTFQNWLEPALGPHQEVKAGWLAGVAVLVAVAGIWLAWRFHDRRWHGPLANLLRNHWYVDQLYHTVIVRGVAHRGGYYLGHFDRLVVDGGVNGAAAFTRGLSRLSMFWDRWVIDGAVRAVGTMAKMGSFPVRFAQNGSVQSYALVLIAGLVALLWFSFGRPV